MERSHQVKKSSIESIHSESGAINVKQVLLKMIAFAGITFIILFFLTGAAHAASPKENSKRDFYQLTPIGYNNHTLKGEK